MYTCRPMMFPKYWGDVARASFKEDSSLHILSENFLMTFKIASLTEYNFIHLNFRCQTYFIVINHK